MTKDERISLAIVVIAMLIGFGILFYWVEYRISLLQDRIERAEIVQLDLQCRHVLFEDGSTLHADAERTAECAYTKGG